MRAQIAIELSHVFENGLTRSGGSCSSSTPHSGLSAPTPTCRPPAPPTNCAAGSGTCSTSGDNCCRNWRARCPSASVRLPGERLVTLTLTLSSNAQASSSLKADDIFHVLHALTDESGDSCALHHHCTAAGGKCGALQNYLDKRITRPASLEHAESVTASQCTESQ